MVKYITFTACLFASLLLFYFVFSLILESSWKYSHLLPNRRPVNIHIGIGHSPPSLPNTISLNPFLNGSAKHNSSTFPFLISDIDGRVPFYVNDEIPECSSINQRHEHYDVEYQTKLHMKNCATTREHYLQSKLARCTHGSMRKTFVQSKRLSTFIKQHGFKRIRYLTIDAQGSGFAIIKDFIDNTMGVPVRKISLNCQLMNQSIPRWLAANDCDAIKQYMANKFQPSLHVVEQQTNCQSNEVKMTFSRLYHKSRHDDVNVTVKREPPGVVDIDIGTLGKPMPSKADKLITFDPFDKLQIQDNFERYPFVISDIDGDLPFFANDRVGGCSTLNLRNEHYDVAYQTKIHRERCGTTRQKFLDSFLVDCMHFPLRTMRVRSVRLSRFVSERNIVHIKKLKIDAQGSDFAILKDVVENTGAELRIDSVTIECQVYNRSIPLYFISNDCGDIEEYMASKFEGFKIYRDINNCEVGEYNLKYRKLRRKTSSFSIDSNP